MVLLLLSLVGLLALVYFIPTIIAIYRDCKSRNGIEAVNLFLGWTFMGWVVALAWAANGETTESKFKESTVGK